MENGGIALHALIDEARGATGWPECGRLLERASQQARALERRVREMEVLNELGRRVAAILDLDELMPEVLALAQRALGLPACALLLLEDDGVHLAVSASIGYPGSHAGSVRIRLGQAVTGRVAASGRPTLVRDVQRFEGYVAGTRGGRCEMAVPMIIRDKVIGVLDAESPTPGGFNQTDLELFATFAAYAAVAVYNAQLYRQLRQGPRHDSPIADGAACLAAAASLAGGGDDAGFYHSLFEGLAGCTGCDGGALLARTGSGPVEPLWIQPAGAETCQQGCDAAEGLLDELGDDGELVEPDLTRDEDGLPLFRLGRSRMAAAVPVSGGRHCLIACESLRPDAFDGPARAHFRLARELVRLHFLFPGRGAAECRPTSG